MALKDLLFSNVDDVKPETTLHSDENSKVIGKINLYYDPEHKGRPFIVMDDHHFGLADWHYRLKLLDTIPETKDDEVLGVHMFETLDKVKEDFSPFGINFNYDKISKTTLHSGKNERAEYQLYGEYNPDTNLYDLNYEGKGELLVGTYKRFSDEELKEIAELDRDKGLGIEGAINELGYETFSTVNENIETTLHSNMNLENILFSAEELGETKDLNTLLFSADELGETKDLNTLLFSADELSETKDLNTLLFSSNELRETKSLSTLLFDDSETGGDSSDDNSDDKSDVIEQANEFKDESRPADTTPSSKVKIEVEVPQDPAASNENKALEKVKQIVETFHSEAAEGSEVACVDCNNAEAILEKVKEVLKEEGETTPLGTTTEVVEDPKPEVPTFEGAPEDPTQPESPEVGVDDEEYKSPVELVKEANENKDTDSLELHCRQTNKRKY